MDRQRIATRLRKPALVVLACYWIYLVVATHVPQPRVIVPLDMWDKLQHATAYGVLVILILFNWSLRASVRWPQFMLAWSRLALFGIVDELTQIPVGRDCDPLDWLADTSGALAGIALFATAALLIRQSGSPMRRT